MFISNRYNYIFLEMKCKELDVYFASMSEHCVCFSFELLHPLCIWILPSLVSILPLPCRAKCANIISLRVRREMAAPRAKG